GVALTLQSEESVLSGAYWPRQSPRVWRIGLRTLRIWTTLPDSVARPSEMVERLLARPRHSPWRTWRPGSRYCKEAPRGIFPPFRRAARTLRPTALVETAPCCVPWCTP